MTIPEWFGSILADSMVREFLIWCVVGGGMGILVKKSLDWFFPWWEQDHGSISTETKRYVAYAASALEPTVIYAFYVISNLGDYVFSQHFALVSSAFMASQYWHARTDLRQKKLEERERDILEGKVLPPEPTPGQKVLITGGVLALISTVITLLIELSN